MEENIFKIIQLEEIILKKNLKLIYFMINDFWHAKHLKKFLLNTVN